MSQEKAEIIDLKKQQQQDFRSSTEVRQPLARRVWSAEAKLRILREIDALPSHKGEIGRYLRSKGLYFSVVHSWRQSRARGELTATTKNRGPAPLKTKDQIRIAVLEKANLKLQKDLEISHKLIELQKKIAEILGTQS